MATAHSKISQNEHQPTGDKTPPLQNGSEFPPKADLRKMCSRYPLPVIAPGTVEPMSSKEATKIATAVLKSFNDALSRGDAVTLESTFYSGQAYWKDQLALTYHMRTFTTPSIAAALIETGKLREAGGFEIEGKAIFVQATPVLVRYSSQHKR